MFTYTMGLLEQRLSEDDIELVKQHRLLKKRLRSLCDELVVKRESSAIKIQETARSYHQSVHDTMVSSSCTVNDYCIVCKLRYRKNKNLRKK